jgi:GNAT superfamily N-acetyltransferase
MKSEFGSIRPARRADIETLVAFTVQEAREAERLMADIADVRRGVEAAFANPPRATYWVVEDATSTVIASCSVVTEWSDFHGGEYWWIQSIFITEHNRGTGLLERLIDHLDTAAVAAGALDLRLYAHASNERALRAYRRCGFVEARYVILTRQLRSADSTG